MKKKHNIERSWMNVPPQRLLTKKPDFNDLPTEDRHEIVQDFKYDGLPSLFD